MSGSETGAVVTTREPFTVGFQKSPPPSQSQPVVQSMRLAYRTDGTAVYKSLSDSSPSPYHPVAATEVSAAPVAVLPPPPHNLNMNMGESVKRKRGRPRKYGPDGSISLALVVSPASAPPSSGAFSPPFQSPQPATSPLGVSASGSSMKKARGRPPGSSKKQQMETLGSAGIGFTPHIITVKAGEDVSSKIMSFSQNGPRAVCILSANGAISNVTLRQAATSGGTATYEGRFDILSLSGSFLPSAVGGQRSRTGGLSVSLAGPDGRVLGGCVAGLLTAASPVQVIVGSFITDGRKGTKANNQMEPLSAPQKLILGGSATVPNSPPSRGTLSESPGSSLNQSTGACNNNLNQSTGACNNNLNQSTGACNNNLNQSTGACNNNNPQGMSSMPWK